MRSEGPGDEPHMRQWMNTGKELETRSKYVDIHH